jgi:MFS family permease
VSFWTIQIAGFSFTADAIPEDRRGRLFSVYNTVMALAWGPAGFFVGGPLADMQVKILGLTPHLAFINTFYASSTIVAVGTLLFVLKVARQKPKPDQILKTTST